MKRSITSIVKKNNNYEIVVHEEGKQPEDTIISNQIGSDESLYNYHPPGSNMRFRWFTIYPKCFTVYFEDVEIERTNEISAKKIIDFIKYYLSLTFEELLDLKEKKKRSELSNLKSELYDLDQQKRKIKAEINLLQTKEEMYSKLNNKIDEVKNLIIEVNKLNKF